jgi:TolB protein
MEETVNRSLDYLVINHHDGREERVPIPRAGTTPIRIGRETDNDIVLSDPRASRAHAQVRRGPEGLEIMDLGSANGTFLGGQPIGVNVWRPLPPGAVAYVGDTTFTYQPGIASAATTRIAPVSAPPPAAPAPTSSPAPARSVPTFLPWIGIIGVLIVAILIVAVAAAFWLGRNTPGPEAATVISHGPLAQTPAGAPAGGATPAEETSSVPYPDITIEKVQVQPLILGALPDPTKALIIVRVRVENEGTGDFIVSPDQFQLIDASGLVLNEAGGSYSQDGLRKMGLADRYKDLRLTSGGSVPESLLFTGQARAYQLFLRYQSPGLQPISLDLGTIDAGREVSMALGTPAPGETPASVAQATPLPTLTPTITATRPALAAARTVPRASLVGVIAYPVFNGQSFDIHVGNADGSGNRFLLANASQPQFSPDGQRIAYHSWEANKRALITVNVAGGGEHIIAGNLEDQLPTWTSDGANIVFLTRRSGNRASELFAGPQDGSQKPAFIGNAEYPTGAPNNMLAFKGWESTGVGLRLGGLDLSGAVVLSDNETDTAPAVSPDGKQVAFMSRRDGNWNIYIVRSDGKGLKQLTTDKAEDGLPTWSPDGKAIAFASNRGGPWAVWAITPDGSGARQLFTMEGSPDGFVPGQDINKSRGWAEERISWTK